jgi:protein involved in polysaccharide export with SLBB domain
MPGSISRKHPKKYYLWFSIIICCLLMNITSKVFGIVINDLQKELRVENFNRDIIKKNRGGNSLENFDENLYEKERENVINQLDIITGNEEARYIITPGDSLLISYDDRGQKQTSLYQVSGEGEIYLPLVGSVKVSGYNQLQTRSRLNEVLGLYIRNPHVTLKINQFGRFMILGAVARPGLYSVSQNLTVMEAILGAGSYTKNSAKMKSVVVMRGPVDQPIIAKLNLKKMIKKGDRSENILVKPGDLVYVPTTLLSSLDSLTAGLYEKVLLWYGLGGQEMIKAGEPFFGPYNKGSSSSTTTTTTTE